jgi:hypothetical protein
MKWYTWAIIIIGILALGTAAYNAYDVKKKLDGIMSSEGGGNSDGSGDGSDDSSSSDGTTDDGSTTDDGTAGTSSETAGTVG